MTTIQRSQLTRTGRKTAVTEASTIGLAPGEWPKTIRIAENGETFERIRLAGEGARFQHRKTGAIIVVLND